MHSINDLFVIFPPRLDKDIVALIERHSHLLTLPAKKIFVRPGDPIKTIYYIKKGRTKHYMISPDGIEKVIYILSAGWFLRESTFVVDDDKTAKRYSMTEIPTEILSINKDDYEELIKDSSFSKSLLQSSCMKSEVLRRREESLAFDSGKERLLKLLFSLTDNYTVVDSAWHPLIIQYTHAEMSSIIGVNRVTVSRFMAQLAVEGKVRIVNRKIQVSKDLSLDNEW